MKSWCENNCPGDCSKGLTIDTIVSFRNSFWGGIPTAIERRKKTAAALVAAQTSYLRLASVEALDPKMYPDAMRFRANGKFVCQKYFANLVGMGDAKGFKNKVWVDEVKKCVAGHPLKLSKLTKKERDAVVQSKMEHAYAHIKRMVESQVMDMSAHVNFENHLYLPYRTVTCFFDEYVFLCTRMGMPLYAKKTTFDTAFKKVVNDKKRNGIHIRMSNSKGLCCALNKLSLFRLLMYQNSMFKRVQDRLINAKFVIMPIDC
jgi:hypothetical protein